MATNPQQLLNQTVPVASQPTAQQPALSQTGSTVPVGQLPGVAQAPSLGASSSSTAAGGLSSFPQTAQLLSTAAPGQPTQPGLLSQVASLPQAQPYYSMIPFLAAMEQQPQISLPQYSDPALAGIQQRLLAQQQANPLLNGQKPIAPQSVLAKSQAPMSVPELLSTAGQQLWQQEIVNPVQDYINTWKTNPTQGLLETIGGVAVTAGLIGLEAVTAGAATPFIFGALAALQAPSLIQSWGQEVTNPSDQHLVQAMVSTGSAALAVGSPVRAFKGMKVARTLFEAQVQLRKDATTADRVAELLTGVRQTGAGVPGVKTGAALTRQMDTLDVNNVEALRSQLEARDISLDKGPGADLLQHAQTLEKLRGDIEQATASGDVEAVGHAMAEIKGMAGDLKNSLLTTAYHHIFLPSTPYAHVPLAAIEGVGAEVQSALHENYSAIYGLLRQMHSGVGLQGPSDMATRDIASIKEAEGLDRAAGTPHDTANRIELHWQEMRNAIGIGSIDVPAITRDQFEQDYVYHGTSQQAADVALKEGHKTGGNKSRNFFTARNFDSTKQYARMAELRLDVLSDSPGAVTLIHKSNIPDYAYEAAADAGEHDYLEWEPKQPLVPEFVVPANVSDPYEYLFGKGGPRRVQESADATEERILQALEEPKKWDQLSPEEQAYGQKLRDFFDAMTAGELKFGYISHPLQGRVPYSFTAPALHEDEQAQQILETQAERPHQIEPRAYGSRSRQWKMAVDELGNVEFQAKNRAQILEKQLKDKARYEATHEHRQVMDSHEQEIKTARRAYGQHKGKNGDAVKADALLQGVRQKFGDVAADLASMSNSELKKVMRARPVANELITGAEAVRRAFRSHSNRMQRAVFGEALQVHSNLAVSKLEDIFKKLPMENWGAAMATSKFKEAHDFPDVLPETVWQESGNVEEAARKMGYFPIHPATGTKGDLNYHPALYGRGKMANDIAKAVNEATSAQAQSKFMDGLYNLSGVSKRFIMYNPVYHALNVAGRAIAFFMSDPAIAGSAFKAVKELYSDKAAYNSLIEESSMAGMVHATQWNVGDKVRRLLAEEDGQSTFPGAIRSVIGALNNFHKDTMERGLWSTVDQLQLAGYMYSKTRFMERGIKEFEARRLAAQYANNLGGMVNPLYMSRLWRQLKGMLFFAPSYWSTFLHSLQSVMPGSARLSQVLNERAGGRFAALAAVPLRAIDQRSRIELVRAQRDWMVTYLASTAVAMDMMNVMFSGHHLWENEQGHEWDVDVTNMPLLGGTQTSPSGEVRRAYITSMPFFRQGVDIGSAIGLGNDWGFGHVFGDQTWQQQDALHKVEMATGALLDGMRRTASTKVGQVPQLAYGAATGEELTSRLGEGTQVQIDRPAAILGLAPGGYQLERLWKTYQQDAQQYQPGTPEYQQAQQQFQQQVESLLPSALLNQTGLPSVYHMGVERPPIDDSKFENWVTQRDASHQRMTQYSNAVFAGTMTPLEYTRHKSEEQIRINQLNTDTWGTNSPGATLSSAYSDLSHQFGLDNPALSDQQWFEAYDAFLPAWQQLLQSAPPATRAAYWEHSTAQWTDADYLEWEARELRDSLAASIDGQGGNYIRAFQNQLFQLKPTLTVAQYTALENSDPYYSAYKTMLTAMGQTSPLGAFVSAFSSPFTKTYIPPAGTTPEEAQALAQATGQIVIRGEAAQAEAQQAKQVAQSPQVAQAGGVAAASPEFQQEEEQAVQAAESGVPEVQQQ